MKSIAVAAAAAFGFLLPPPRPPMPASIRCSTPRSLRAFIASCSAYGRRHRGVTTSLTSISQARFVLACCCCC